jgi:hypothetical protein
MRLSLTLTSPVINANFPCTVPLALPIRVCSEPPCVRSEALRLPSRDLAFADWPIEMRGGGQGLAFRAAADDTEKKAEYAYPGPDGEGDCVLAVGREARHAWNALCREDDREQRRS